MTARIELPNKWDGVAWIRERYESTNAADLVSMLVISLGKTVQQIVSAGKLGGRNADEYENGLYAALFTDGTGLMVDYSAGCPGYSEYTPGYPGSVSYYTLKARAGESQS